MTNIKQVVVTASLAVLISYLLSSMAALNFIPTIGQFIGLLVAFIIVVGILMISVSDKNMGYIVILSGFLAGFAGTLVTSFIGGQFAMITLIVGIVAGGFWAVLVSLVHMAAMKI